MQLKFRKTVEQRYEGQLQLGYFVDTYTKTIGYIFATLSYDNIITLRSGNQYFTNATLFISSFGIDAPFQGYGIGNQLLNYLIDDVYNINVKRIELDDMSDRHREDGNIYVKNGFRYVSEYGPEMIKFL